MNVGSFNGDVSTSTIAEMNSLEPGEINFLTSKADHTVYVGYDFYAKNNPNFHIGGKYGFNEGGILIYFPLVFINNLPFYSLQKK